MAPQTMQVPEGMAERIARWCLSRGLRAGLRGRGGRGPDRGEPAVGPARYPPPALGGGASCLAPAGRGTHPYRCHLVAIERGKVAGSPVSFWGFGTCAQCRPRPF